MWWSPQLKRKTTAQRYVTKHGNQCTRPSNPMTNMTVSTILAKSIESFVAEAIDGSELKQFTTLFYKNDQTEIFTSSRFKTTLNVEIISEEDAQTLINNLNNINSQIKESGINRHICQLFRNKEAITTSINKDKLIV